MPIFSRDQQGYLSAGDSTSHKAKEENFAQDERPNSCILHHSIKNCQGVESISWLACCFCCKEGRGYLYSLPPKATMNGDRFLNVLEEKLFPWIMRLKASKFLQDRAPCHTSKMISLMDWSGNSTNLDHIENLSVIMKARLKNITALPLLERAIKLMWVKDSLSP
jgi:hypothetical protein